MCDKFRDYLIGSKFTVLTDNNPLTYVHTSRLGMAQIRWLSDLMLFDFEIKYRAGKTNQAADALSQQPENPNSSSESSDDEEEWDTISYEMVCQILNHHLNSTKLPYHVKHEVQTNIMEVDEANKLEGFKSTNIVNSATKRGENLSTPLCQNKWMEYQKKDPQLSLVYDKVLSKSKPRLSEIHHIRSRPTRRLLLQYDRFIYDMGCPASLYL